MRANTGSQARRQDLAFVGLLAHLYKPQCPFRVSFHGPFDVPLLRKNPAYSERVLVSGLLLNCGNSADFTLLEFIRGERVYGCMGGI